METTAHPNTPGAAALVSGLLETILAGEARQRPRGPRETQKVRDATGAIVGAMLRAWRRGKPVALSLAKAGLGDLPGGRVAARVVLDQLGAQGFLRRREGVRWWCGFGFQGKASRFWPGEPLLTLAATYGVLPDTVRLAFLAPPPTHPPAPAAPIVVRGFKVRGKEAPEVPPETLGLPLAALSAEVVEWNAWAATWSVTGCRPPRWQRHFKMHQDLGGRWYALGTGHYQTMSKEARGGIRINGEPVVEIDVRAAVLSIMHGLMGLPLPEGDLYAIEGFPREAVKAWVTATLGKGSPVRRWAAEAPTAGRRFDPVALGAAICQRYPCLTDPAGQVARAAGLMELRHLGTPRQLLGHRLQGLEAAGVTGAMRVLRRQGVPALPVHDSLLVPQAAIRATLAALADGFDMAAAVRITATRDGLNS